MGGVACNCLGLGEERPVMTGVRSGSLKYIFFFSPFYFQFFFFFKNQIFIQK